MSGVLSQLMSEIPRYVVWLNQIRGVDGSWPTSLKLDLIKISNEIKLYDQAFSPMAKRNVAMSIVDRLDAFTKAWKRAYGIAPLPKPLVDLAEAARKEAGADSGHKYDYVSCVGYCVKTGKFDAHHFEASWNGTRWKRYGLVEYSGDSIDTVDYLARCVTLRQAIDAAYNQYSGAHGSNPNDAKTLKIFMAPEFYFRGLQGAYDISLVSKIFDNLRTFTQDERFKDWLFVFGTVIGASFDDRLECRNCGKSGASQFVRTGLRQYACTGCPPDSVGEKRLGARIDNVALIQKGGESDVKNAHVIEKEYVSFIDFRRYASRYALRRGAEKTSRANTAILKDWDEDRRIKIMGRRHRALAVPGSRDVGGGNPSRFTDERMGGSIFTIDGIKFGLEICLDHLNGKIPPGTGIQIQLVPSAGAYLKQLVCVTDGIGFNVDGQGADSDVQVNSSGALTKPPSISASVSVGGSIKIFAPQMIPYG